MRFLPNLLTLCRLAMTIFIGSAILSSRFGEALSIFAAAAATDFLDGYLARRFRWISRVGMWLDPVVDKFLLGTVYLVLYSAGRLPGWLVTIMVGRDVLLLCETVWALAFTELRNFSPVHLGQASTLLQVVIVVAVLAAPIRPTPELKSIAEALFAPAAALAIASFIHYSWRGIAMVAATRSPLR